jgi:hypothetical protein
MGGFVSTADIIGRSRGGGRYGRPKDGLGREDRIGRIKKQGGVNIEFPAAANENTGSRGAGRQAQMIEAAADVGVGYRPIARKV